MRPAGVLVSVPRQGKKPTIDPLLSFWKLASSVNEVAALGRQVNDGAMK
jgi:hypothetical protein